MVKNLPTNAGDLRDLGSIPGLGRSPGGGNGSPLWYSCLENPMDRGAWWATVHGVTKSRTRLKQLSKHEQNAGGILEKLRDVQEDAELPRSQEDTVSVRMGWSTLYQVQLPNQFPPTHVNPCD